MPRAQLDPRLADDLRAYATLRTLWRDDPERYAWERLGQRATWQQRKIFDAISAPGAHVSVRSGHGTGKTGSIAAIVWWFLETRDHPKVPCTAPTASQLRDVLWAELGKWLRNADVRSARRGDHKATWLSTLFRLTTDRVYDPSARNEWFATARTSSRDNPDALQGFHAGDVEISADGHTAVHHGDGDDAGRILFVVDEAAGVPDAVFEVAEGALSSPGSRLLMAANPTRRTGYFADSHQRNRAHYTTIHLRSHESPLSSPDYREKLVRKWGEDSNIVRVRADGEFPRQDDDVLIPLEHAELAINRQPPSKNPAQLRIGIDCARFGDDRTVYLVRQGTAVLHIEIAGRQDTMRTTGRAVQLLDRFPGATAFVDELNMGAGVVDRLRELGRPVVAVNVSRSAPPRPRGRHEGNAKRLRDYLWLEMADWLATEEVSFGAVERELAEELAGELCTTTYGLDSSGEIVIESKDEQKTRLGHSPDIADALGCTFAPGAAGPQYATAGGRVFTL